MAGHKMNCIFRLFVFFSIHATLQHDVNCESAKSLARGVFPFLSDCTLGVNEIRLLYYTRNTSIPNGNISMVETDSRVLLHHSFNASLRTVFVVHGFLGDGQMGWINDTVSGLLDEKPSNIFSVDWRVGACSEKVDLLNVQSYSAAKLNSERVGEFVAGYISMLSRNHSLKTENVWIIGHSLGAHVSGFVGKYLQVRGIGKIGRITGLDPAGPGFKEKGPYDRLDETDAKFVEVIHTCNIFGIQNPIGHVNFYFNGGKFQPGCLMRKIGCSHMRAVHFYAEAVKNPNCQFRGKLWSQSSGFENSPLNCTENSCTVLGPQADEYPARGSFYISTQSQKPFCTGELPLQTGNPVVPVGGYENKEEDNLFTFEI